LILGGCYAEFLLFIVTVFFKDYLYYRRDTSQQMVWLLVEMKIIIEKVVFNGYSINCFLKP
jgi:hypothetical protein